MKHNIHYGCIYLAVTFHLFVVLAFMIVMLSVQRAIQRVTGFVIGFMLLQVELSSAWRPCGSIVKNVNPSAKSKWFSCVELRLWAACRAVWHQNGGHLKQLEFSPHRWLACLGRKLRYERNYRVVLAVCYSKRNVVNRKVMAVTVVNSGGRICHEAVWEESQLYSQLFIRAASQRSADWIISTWLSSNFHVKWCVGSIDNVTLQSSGRPDTRGVTAARKVGSSCGGSQLHIALV
jgi:hypothetical protein